MVQIIHDPSSGVWLYPGEASALDWALHLHDVLDGAYCGTGRGIRLVTMRRLQHKRLVEESWAYIVDGDGFKKDPEQYRRCFKLTPFGIEVARRIKTARQEEARIDITGCSDRKDVE